MGHSRPRNSSLGPPFVRYAPDSDRRRGNAAKAAKCQQQTLIRATTANKFRPAADPLKDCQ